jgi:hypothetical protein
VTWEEGHDRFEVMERGKRRASEGTAALYTAVPAILVEKAIEIRGHRK